MAKSKRIQKIQWSRSDVASLRGAVRTFNNEIAKQVAKGNINVQPITYQEAKDRIYSRKDLNLTLDYLKSVKKKGAFKEEAISGMSNKTMPHFQYQALKKYDKIHRENMKREINYISKQDTKHGVTENVAGHEFKVPKMVSPRIRQLEKYLDTPNIELLNSATDIARVNELIDRITKFGYDKSILDYGEIYKENYLKMFETYRNMDNYELVREKLEGTKPEDFYYMVRDNDVNYDDFEYQYKNGLLQDEFNALAMRLGVDINANDSVDSNLTY